MATKYKRQADGYFQTRIWDGSYLPSGEKRRVTLRSKKSSGDLEKKVAKFRQDVEQRKNIRKTDVSFCLYARKWFKVYKASSGTATKAMYDNIIEKHLICLEGINLCDIDRIHLQLCLNNAEGKPRTQQQIRMTFKQILRSAVADHLFPANVYEDLFRNIDAVKYKPKEKRALTSSEKKAIFKADFEPQDKIFVYILYGCGLRREEALALTVFDFNLKRKELTINKAHALANETPELKDPKTSNGFRTVPIPDRVFPEIERYIHQLTAANRIYLFTMRSGEPITKSSYDKMWRRILKRMKEASEEPIVGLTAHVFRHNYCTQLCYQIPSVSIKKIAQLMGDTEAVVLKVYNHIVLEQEDAAGAVNSAII